jgi:hypothetical protein
MAANTTESQVRRHSPCRFVIANGPGPPIPSSALKIKEGNVISKRFQRKAAEICDGMAGNSAALHAAAHGFCIALHKIP